MKNFTFIDERGDSHTFRPAQFASTASVDNLPYPLSDSVGSDLAEYARKAYHYMAVRRGGFLLRRNSFKALADKVSFLASCGFPDTPPCDVLDAFAQAHALQPVYRHHVALCRGYVPVSERQEPPIEFYFGTFGGGFAYYTEFSTSYRYRHLLLLSSWWFSHGDVLEGYSDSKVEMFEDFCKYGELSIGS